MNATEMKPVSIENLDKNARGEWRFNLTDPNGVWPNGIYRTNVFGKGLWRVHNEGPDEQLSRRLDFSVEDAPNKDAVRKRLKRFFS